MLRARLEPQVPRVLLVLQGLQVQRVLQVLLEPQVLLARLELQARRVLQVLLEPQVLLARLELQARRLQARQE